MGGSDYYKRGVSLERASQYNVERLRDLKDMYEAIEGIKKDINPNISESKKSFEEMFNCIKGG
jgi:hypothetical protein